MYFMSRGSMMNIALSICLTFYLYAVISFSSGVFNWDYNRSFLYCRGRNLLTIVIALLLLISAATVSQYYINQYMDEQKKIDKVAKILLQMKDDVETFKSEIKDITSGAKK